MANVAQKYAKALFDVSVDQDILDDIFNEFKTVSNVASTQIDELKAFDENPTRSARDRHTFAVNVFGEVNDYLKNMMFVLANNRHLALINDIFSSFQKLYNKKYNQDFAEVESVYELDEEELAQIEKVITQQTNLSHVILTTKINPELIGGIRVKVGTTVIDGSVKNDLQQLTTKFKRSN